MLSRKTSRNYEILDDGESMPYKIPRVLTDRTLRDIRDGMHKVNQAIRRLWEDGSNDAYPFVMRRLLPYDMQEDDGKVWHLLDMEHDAAALLAALQTKNDEIPEPWRVATPEDYGYNKSFGWNRKWEKQIRNDDELTITKELIVQKDGKILHRLCTITWETMPGIRSSTSIRYKTLRLGKRLEAACRNACNPNS